MLILPIFLKSKLTIPFFTIFTSTFGSSANLCKIWKALVNNLSCFLTTNKNFSKWISSFYGCGFDVKNIINESIFPPLRSSHSILIDCTYKNSPDKKGFDENDMSDQCFLNKLHDVEKNKNFIKSLQPNFE